MSAVGAVHPTLSCKHAWIKGLAGYTCSACKAFCQRDASGLITYYVAKGHKATGEQ